MAGVGLVVRDPVPMAALLGAALVGLLLTTCLPVCLLAARRRRTCCWATTRRDKRQADQPDITIERRVTSRSDSEAESSAGLGSSGSYTPASRPRPPHSSIGWYNALLPNIRTIILFA